MVLDMRTVLEYLYDVRARNLPPVALAEVFDKLIWCTADNGAEILRVAEDWLKGNNREKVQIALTMSEVFPFGSLEEMEQELGAVAQRWPEFSARCQELIESRKIEESR